MNSDYQRKKQLFGITYGLACGLAFAVFAWGTDAITLSRAHSSFSFLKFIVGMLISLPLYAWVGYTVVNSNSHAMSFLLWLGTAVAMTWLVVWLPTDGSKEILKELNPALFPLLKYRPIDAVWQYRFFAFLIISLAALICGLLEINLVDAALHSSAYAGLLTMILVGVVLFGIAGSAVDYLINTPFREPVVAVNDLIQFGRENAGREVPANIARKKHLSSLNTIQDLINEPYQLTIISYDRFIGQVEILVKFGNVLVQCTSIYSQPTNCVRLNNDT